MNDTQKIAIDHNVVELIDTLEVEYPILITHLHIKGIFNLSETQLVENHKTDRDRLNYLIQMIKGKLGSWEILLEYLNDHRHADLADSLRRFAGVEVVGDKSALTRFLSALAQSYKSPECANIPSLWGDPKSVRDFWVPLRAEEKTKVFAKGERLDHAELLKCLAEREDSDVALVIGDPGTGKTTLVKKITYDWAVTYETNPEGNQFRLVLSVPLRSVGKFGDFYDVVELTIDYFLETLKLGRKLRFSPNDKSDLIQLVNDLDSKLLIILDGLDEYNNYDERLFKSFFAPKFSRSPQTCAKLDQPAIVDYKLIITSRPYACRQINVEFLPTLKFQLCLLDRRNLEKFVDIYCQRQSGKVAVNQYIKRNRFSFNSIFKVPLILTFVCYLADSNMTEIPANLTLLYENLIRQTLRREGKEEKLEEMINTLGKLAYLGCKVGKYEFAVESVEELNVSNDSFTCGFLVDKFDFADSRRKVEFCHRSIQEFFAALYAYKMIAENYRDERLIVWQIFNYKYHQFDRFLFGICSERNRFGEMVDWISANICDFMLPEVYVFAPEMLADCTAADQLQFGQILRRSLANFEEGLIAKWNRRLFPHGICLSPSFKSGLNLKPIQPESTSYIHDNYYISEGEQPRIATLVCPKDFSPIDTVGRFDRIDNFMWSPDSLSLRDELWNRLITTTFAIKMRTAVIQVYFCELNITFVIKYGHEIKPLVLTVFRFGFDSDQLTDLLSNFNRFDTNCIEVGERESSEVHRDQYRRLNVTVVRTVSQTTLIRSLIKQSLIEFS